MPFMQSLLHMYIKWMVRKTLGFVTSCPLLKGPANNQNNSKRGQTGLELSASNFPLYINPKIIKSLHAYHLRK